MFIYKISHFYGFRGANRGKMAIGIKAGKTEENEDMVAGNAGMVAGRNGIMTIFP